MNNTQSNNPLHGVTLEKIVTQLAEHYGWEELGKRINIRCFKEDPSVKSSLKFLRKNTLGEGKSRAVVCEMSRFRIISASLLNQKEVMAEE